MTRNQAMNYLRCSGMNDEQVETFARMLSGKDGNLCLLMAKRNLLYLMSEDQRDCVVKAFQGC